MPPPIFEEKPSRQRVKKKEEQNIINIYCTKKKRKSEGRAWP